MRRTRFVGLWIGSLASNVSAKCQHIHTVPKADRRSDRTTIRLSRHPGNKGYVYATYSGLMFTFCSGVIPFVLIFVFEYINQRKSTHWLLLFRSDIGHSQSRVMWSSHTLSVSICPFRICHIYHRSGFDHPD